MDAWKSAVSIRHAAVGAVIFAGFLLALLVGGYRLSQRELLLEANKLHTGEAMVIDAPLEQVAKELPNLGSDARVFADLNGEYLRLIVANDYEGLPLPIHGGRGLTNDDAPQALVGAEVPLTKDGSCSYYELGGIRHEVVGYLGQNPDSVLSRSAVLKSPQLVSQVEPEMITADGHTAGARLRQQGIRAESVYHGIERRTNADAVSPVVFWTGGALCLLAFASAGIVYGQGRLEYMRVKRLLGAARWRTHAGMLLRLGAIAVLGMAASVLLVWAVPLRLPPASIIAQAAAAALAVIATAASAVTAKEK